MKMNRVFLKLSGEALAGPKKTGFDEETVKEVARQVKLSVDAEMCIRDSIYGIIPLIGRCDVLKGIIKNAAVSLLVCMMLPLTGMVSLAGQWEQDHLGIWSYRYHDGDLLKGNWYWIDGNLDGTAECYCFDAQGSLYQNTVTPDGYTVDSSGAWMQDLSLIHI